MYDNCRLMNTDDSKLTFDIFMTLPTEDPLPLIASGRALLSELPETSPHRPDIKYRIGLALIVHGQYESAFRSLSEARHIHEENGEHRKSLEDQIAFGTIYGLSEQPEAAFETFLSIRDRARESDYQEVEEAADFLMGRICFDQGRYEEGLGFVDAALKIIETTGNRQHRIEALKERGRIELHLGHSQLAAADLEQARRLSLEAGSEESYELLICLGDLHTRTGHFEDADVELNRALRFCRERAIPYGEILALFHLGNLKATAEDLDSGVEYWKECYARADKLVLWHLKIKSGEKLVSHFQRNDRPLEALNYLQDIRKIESELRNERLHHTISVYDQSMRIDDLEQEMHSWRRRSGELEKIRSDREEAIRELKTITLIGEKITASLDPDTIVEVLHDSLSQLVTVDSLLISFYDSAVGEMDIRYIIEEGRYLEPVRIPIKEDESLTSWVVLHDRDLMVNSREEATAYTKIIRHLEGSKHLNQSFLIVRLRIEGRIIGVLSVQAVEKDRYKESHLQVLQALASFIAIAMTNSSAHQSLVAANAKIAHMATHDPLTGLPNRMQIMHRLGQELERYKRYDSALAVLFIDLDGFKAINDTWGHKAGDGVLRAVAERLSRGIRATDASGRLAGDEFLVILTDDCTPEKGLHIAEQIRESLSRPIEFEGNRLQVTASIGLAFCPDDGSQPGDLVNAADQAMYDAKAAGKDNTRIHQSA